MYDVTNKTKKELVGEICRQLNEHGFEDTGVFGHKSAYTADDGFGEGLGFLPKENLEKILQTEITDWSDFGKVYEAWGRAKALRFMPYMVDEDDNPSLVLRHNRFLHMFRGYRWQVSSTVDGQVDNGSSSYSTNFLTAGHREEEVLSKSLLAYCLWWATLIDVGFRFDNFFELFGTDVNKLNEFLKVSAAYWGKHFDYSWVDVAKCINKESEPIDTITRKVYQLQDSKGVGAYIAIGKKTIQVQTAEKCLTFTIPDPSIGTNYDLDEEDDRDSFHSDMYTLEENHFREIIAVMLLKLAGIHVSFINWFPLAGSRKFKFLRPINSPDVVKAESLNEIYKAIPDEF